MSKQSTCSRLARRLLGCIRKDGRKTCYVCFVPVFKTIVRGHQKSYYVLGIRLWRKTRLEELIRAEVSRVACGDELRKVRLDLLETRILNAHLCGKGLKKTGYYLLFDGLQYAKVESIDAWSLFLYMKFRGIPARYVMRRDDALAASQRENPDVIMVDNQDDFLFRRYDVVAGARCILTSFGLGPMYDGILRRLPYCPYVFMEHGVTLFKEYVLGAYGPSGFNASVASTKGTWELFAQKNVWQEDEMIKHGMARWDSLARQPHEGKNIFIFFTWRTTFMFKPEWARLYFEKILSLLSHPNFRRMVEEHNITVNVALHHALRTYNVALPEFAKGVNLVEMNQISRYIGRADMLITDYSSVCFDFMYLDIPVIFYRFDEDAAHLNDADRKTAQNARSRNEDFYNCVTREEEALSLIKHYALNGFELEEENIRKNEAFFWEKKDICKGICESLEQLCENM